MFVVNNFNSCHKPSYSLMKNSHCFENLDVKSFRVFCIINFTDRPNQIRNTGISVYSFILVGILTISICTRPLPILFKFYVSLWGGSSKGTIGISPIPTFGTSFLLGFSPVPTLGTSFVLGFSLSPHWAPPLFWACPQSQLGAPPWFWACPQSQLGAPPWFWACLQSQLGAPPWFWACPQSQLGAPPSFWVCPQSQLGAPPWFWACSQSKIVEGIGFAGGWFVWGWYGGLVGGEVVVVYMCSLGGYNIYRF